MDAEGGVGKSVAQLWKGEEVEREVLNMKEVMQWVKDRLPKGIKCAVMLKLTKELSLKGGRDWPLNYYVAFVAANGCVANGSSRYYHCNAIDNALEQGFDGKDVIIFA